MPMAAAVRKKPTRIFRIDAAHHATIALASDSLHWPNGITDKGTTNACKADKASIETAEEAYFANADVGTYVNTTVAAPGALVPKYLHEASKMHEVTDATAASYSVTGTGKCAVPAST